YYTESGHGVRLPPSFDSVSRYPRVQRRRSHEESPGARSAAVARRLPEAAPRAGGQEMNHPVQAGGGRALLLLAPSFCSYCSENVNPHSPLLPTLIKCPSFLARLPP